MSDALHLSNSALAAFYLVFLIPLLLFQRWRLGLSKTLITAFTRMTLQLAIVGLYLQTLFNLDSFWLNTAWLMVMVLMAAWTICKQTGTQWQRTMPAVLTGQLIAIGFMLPVLMLGVIQTSPWWEARYLIPVAGMLLGNTLSANVLAIDRLQSSLKQRHAEYEYYVALGAPKPCTPFVKEAFAAALRPPMAAMSTLGIVSLPGMMTGQILGGTEPLLAVKYQLVIMIAIFISVVLSTAVSLSMIGKHISDPYGRLTL